MKKIYLLAIALTAFCFTGNSQIVDDNFDSYTLGDLSPQSDDWEPWPAGVSAQVVDDNFFSSPQSMFIRTGATDDQLLLTQNQTTGIFTLQFKVFIPTDAIGFYNFQRTDAVGDNANFAGQVFIGQSQDGANGEPGLITFDFGDEQASYFENTWFTLTHVFDLDNSTLSISMDGTEIYSGPYQDSGDVLATQLGAVDFFSLDPDNGTFYVDDVLFVEGELGIDDFSADVFNVYPNPVKDKLNIESAAAVNSVAVYDVLGKQVLSVQPDAISPSVDMSGLSSGAYLVKVTIGNASKTVKVIK